MHVYYDLVCHTANASSKTTLNITGKVHFKSTQKYDGQLKYTGKWQC